MSELSVPIKSFIVENALHVILISVIISFISIYFILQEGNHRVNPVLKRKVTIIN
jgi:hypothetical protein